MSPERDIEELREWFRALPPDEIVKFVLTLPPENQHIIKQLASEWASHKRPKAAWWQFREDPMGRRYYQNRMTEETHWARAMTGGSGALDACTGIPYHVPLDNLY